MLLGFGFALLPAVAQDDDIIEYVEEVEYDDSAEGAEDGGVPVVSDDESAEVAEGSDKTSQSAEVAVTSESSEEATEIAESSESSDEASATEATTEVASDESTTESSEEATEVAESVESSEEATAEVAESSTEATDESAENTQLEALDEAEFANSDESEYEDVGEVAETTESSDDSMQLGGEPDYTYSTSDDKSDITRWNYTEKEIVKKEKIRQKQAEREAEYEKSIARRRSGIFFGGGMGFSDTSIKGLADSFTSGFLGDGMNMMGIGLGAFAGWQIGFNEYAGVRMYGEFDYNLGKGVIVAKTDSTTVRADNNLWKALGNVDFYLEGSMGRNQTETLGVFLGIGAGYIYYKGGEAENNVRYESLHMIGFVVNYGIHTILGTNHRLELFVRNYPFIKVQAGQQNNNATANYTANMDAWLRYSYMF